MTSFGLREFQGCRGHANTSERHDHINDKTVHPIGYATVASWCLLRRSPSACRPSTPTSNPSNIGMRNAHGDEPQARLYRPVPNLVAPTTLMNSTQARTWCACGSGASSACLGCRGQQWSPHSCPSRLQRNGRWQGVSRKSSTRCDPASSAAKSADDGRTRAVNESHPSYSAYLSLGLPAASHV